MKSDFKERLEKAYESLSSIVSERPKLGLILGSGLGNYVTDFNGKEIPFERIMNFPRTTVEGHKGLYKFSQNAVVQAGRFHFYEGYSMDDVVLPVFLLWKMGVRYLIITNASGGINRNFKAGEFVIIRDHINLMGSNPLIGPNIEDYGPRFPDMTEAYSKKLREIANRAVDGKIKEGVYVALTGPSYETPSEIRMLERIGGDMVGMSTVPEAIAANYLGMKVLGISCVTNMAAGILEKPLSHEEVIETTKRVEKEFTILIEKITEAIMSELIDD